MMSSLEIIEENYRNRTDEYLIRLSEQPEKLTPDAIPVLKRVLLDRSLNEAVEVIDLYEQKVNNEPDPRRFSGEEMNRYIQQRWDSGESSESIKNDLKTKGVDLSKTVFGEEEKKLKIATHVEKLKERGYSDYSVSKDLQKNFGLSQAEADEWLTLAKKKGKKTLILGLSLIFVSILLASMSFAITLPSVLFFVSGIIMIVAGWFQAR